MTHTEILLVVTEFAEPCELCGASVRVGERVELHFGPRAVTGRVEE